MALKFLIADHPLGALAACITPALLGLAAYMYVKVSLLPDTKLPVINITTIYSGASPTEVESIITCKIEDALSGVPWVKNINSFSNEGKSEVTIEFHFGADQAKAALLVSRPGPLPSMSPPAAAGRFLTTHLSPRAHRSPAALGPAGRPAAGAQNPARLWTSGISES